MGEPSPPNPTGSRHRLGALEFELLAELKRRNVFRIAGAYLGTSWFLVHMGTVLGENFVTLHRLMPAVIGVLGAGLPLVLIGAWFFELTPQGFTLTRRAERHHSIRELTARPLRIIILPLLTPSMAAIVGDRRIFHPG